MKQNSATSPAPKLNVITQRKKNDRYLTAIQILQLINSPTLGVRGRPKPPPPDVRSIDLSGRLINGGHIWWSYSDLIYIVLSHNVM